MKASELKSIIEHTLATEGDMDVEISIVLPAEKDLAENPELKDQKCSFSFAGFCDVEDRGLDGKFLSIRDWPY